MRRQILSAFLVVALLSGSLSPALTQPGPEQIDDRPGVEVVATAEAGGGAGTVAKQLSAFLTVPNVLGGWFKTDTVNTTQTDANQTKIDIYQSAQNSNANFEVYNASINNYLEDSMSIALMEGKNAYIKALNNQSSESAALTAAKQAQDDYYSVKEYNLVQRWNNQVANLRYVKNMAQNETGINPGKFIYVDFEDVPKVTNVNVTGYGTTTITLQNQSTVQATTLEVRVTMDGSKVNSASNEYQYYTVGPRFGQTGMAPYNAVEGDPDYTTHIKSIEVAPPTADYQPAEMFDTPAYATALSRIDSQTSDAHNQIANFVNNTYTKYQTGAINNSDLIDPYLAQREYSPNGSFQAWSTMSLTLMGANSPKNLDNVGSFRITAGAAEYRGMLLSDKNPQSGKFETGTTYDPTAIGGQQYVVTDSNVIELKTNFTVQNITNAKGENVQNVTVRTVNYDTANTTEYSQLMQELQTLRAQIEAREQRLRSTVGAGWLPGFGGVGFGKGLLAGGAAGIVVAILGLLAIIALLWPVLGPALIS